MRKRCNGNIHIQQLTTASAGKMTLAQIAEAFAEGRLPLRFSAYDGSSAGPPTPAPTTNPRSDS
jgi:hypothetical protein